MKATANPQLLQGIAAFRTASQGRQQRTEEQRCPERWRCINGRDASKGSGKDLHSAVKRRIFFELKANAPITLRLFMALLLITGTAGISVNQHFCSMMGPSASLTMQSSCCGGNETASRGTESLSRVPCCDNTLQTAAVDQSFEGAPAPRPLLLASVALTADATADAENFFPRTLRSDNDISPHIRLSLSETVNHLRS